MRPFVQIQSHSTTVIRFIGCAGEPQTTPLCLLQLAQSDYRAAQPMAGTVKPGGAGSRGVGKGKRGSGQQQGGSKEEKCRGTWPGVR